MNRAGRIAALLLALAPVIGAASAAAREEAAVVRSTAIDQVAVTVYRAPGRSSGGIDPDWPEGFAFIAETRTVDLPAGVAALRFEGVAEGLLPETAVIGGLPDGVIEKNRDARILSAAGLVDSYLKRRVTLQRTDPATGTARTQDAILQAGPNGGVLLKTDAGYEALGCSGLPERMTYGAVPQDLSAKPTLSVLVESAVARRVTVQLYYLAEGFDWSASYVAERGARADRLAMTGWVTVANGGVTGFPDAQLNVVAGQLEKQDSMGAPEDDAGPLVLKCWPMDITSTHPLWGLPPIIPVRGSQRGGYDGGADDIVVTAQRRRESVQDVPLAISVVGGGYLAESEDLGDLKYYRIPFRTDVAAKQQKQVALLARDNVAYEQIYSVGVAEWTDPQFEPADVVIRLWNRESDGLGLALPAGEVALFEDVAGRRLLVGEAHSSDRAIDERVDFDIGAGNGVRYKIIAGMAKRRAPRTWEVTITNDRDVPAEVELLIPFALVSEPKGIERRGANRVWRVSVAANGKRVERFREKRD